jgi:hypothetical protein
MKRDSTLSIGTEVSGIVTVRHNTRCAMKTKHVFALSGPANVGKSATIKKVFALLTDAYPSASVETIHRAGKDISVIIEINGIFVGIESQGDPNSRLAESIERFKKAKCIVIICATRTSGGTVAAVERLQPEFTLVRHYKRSEPQASLRTQGDDAIARTVFNEVQDVLRA